MNHDYEAVTVPSPNDVFYRAGIRLCAYCLIMFPHRHVDNGEDPKHT